MKRYVATVHNEAAFHKPIYVNSWLADHSFKFNKHEIQMKSLQVSTSILVYTNLFLPKPLYDSTSHLLWLKRWGLLLRDRDKLQPDDFWSDSPPNWYCAFRYLHCCWPTVKTHFLTKIPAQMKHRNTSPRMIFWKLSGSF